MSFGLSLNSIVSPLNENGLTTLTGAVSGLKVPGGQVTLGVDWGELNLTGSTLITDDQSVTLQDGGTGDLDGAANGAIRFSLTHQYLDDNPTGTPADTYTIKVDAKEDFLIGTDAVFVVDVSGSTEVAAAGASFGDVNGDGFSNTILDGEIAAFIALNQQLINQGLGNTAKVSVAIFGETAALLDLDPSVPGVQTYTTAGADKNTSGQLDVVEALRRLRSGGATVGGPNVGGSTNFEAGLQQAQQAVVNAGTVAGAGNVIFLSDGFPNQPNTSFAQYTDEANAIRNTQGQNLRAFGVGTGSSLPALQAIDSNAEQFVNVQDLVDLFAGVGAGTNTASATKQITLQDVAPSLGALTGVPTSIIVEGDTVSLGASFTDVGSQDTHTGTINWGDGNTSNLGTIVGNANGSHTYNTVGNYTATLTVTDDDTLSDSKSAGVVVAKKVVLDWKPGSNPSAMNFRNGSIPVAIFGAANFDVKQIDVSKIRFDDDKSALLSGGGVGVNQKNNGTYQFSYQDSNGDGFLDLVAHVDAIGLGSVVNPLLPGGQIYAYGTYGSNYFLGSQQNGDPIKITG